MLNEKDNYYEFYKESKLTIDEMRQFENFKNHADNELLKLSELIFDLAVTTKKIILDIYE